MINNHTTQNSLRHTMQAAQSAVPEHRLYDTELEFDSCGVGFITNKSGKQTHELMLKGHEALCVIPHRGGMSSEGVGDGAGINMDLSVRFFAKLLGRESLERGAFGVGNFFFPKDTTMHAAAKALVEEKCEAHGIVIALWREVPTDISGLNQRSAAQQEPMWQIVFERPESLLSEPVEAFDAVINDALLAIEAQAYHDATMAGFYPLSMSSRTMVYKGRLNSGEVVPYFKDLIDPDHQISIFLFHTRFSTNTAPAAFMAQPFRWIAHNGELNTDKKNRLSEDAIAKQKNKRVIFPKGQSDSARLDQTIARRLIEDKLDIVTSVVAMMPPAWENDTSLSPEVRAMFEYFSLYEEKNDGPAALVFSDGRVVGAKLDRMGLRPLRTVETETYLAVTSEAGQIDFEPSEVIKRGRIEAGGIICYDHNRKECFTTESVHQRLAVADDYKLLLQKSAVNLKDLPLVEALANPAHEFSIDQRHVAYGLNQESFRLFLDPMVVTGAEKISAMGYGVASNTMTGDEGGMAKYFSQRFAQVTNPPLDSIREKDGMTLRVAIGAKPNFSPDDSQQIVLEGPVLKPFELAQIRQQTLVNVTELEAIFEPSKDASTNEGNLESALQALCSAAEQSAREQPGLIIVSDQHIGRHSAPIPAMLSVAAINQRLIECGLRFNSSVIFETGQLASSHGVASLLGFGAHAVCPLSVTNRILTLNGEEGLSQGLDNFALAVNKSLMKTMGKFGLCTVESYIGGEFFEANCLDTEDPRLKDYYPNLSSPIGGAGFADIAASAAEWFYKSLTIHQESEIPHLGLFKERQGGAGHSFGVMAVQQYKNMTGEELLFTAEEEIEGIFDRYELREAGEGRALQAILSLYAEISTMVDQHEDVAKMIEQTFVFYGIDQHPQAMAEVKAVLAKRVKQSQAQIIDELFSGQHDEEPALIKDALNTLVNDATDVTNRAYKLFGYKRLSPERIDQFMISRAYRNFIKNVHETRALRPAALRDILYFPSDVSSAQTLEDFNTLLGNHHILGNAYIAVRGLKVESLEGGQFTATLTGRSSELRLTSLQHHWQARFPGVEIVCEPEMLVIKSAPPLMVTYFSKLRAAREPISLEQIQPAHEITPCLTAGAMSHGALVGVVHEAVSQGANIAGALSNSGEGGEKARRFDTVKSSTIKQIASGRFGVWAGYFADPNLKEIEIKIAQGAKPGEGGQLPSPKVNVEIASSRGGTPLVELVSPPPHHDTYSIEDLAQLIHDAHAARVKVIVKLVSSEGIGTIAVGVAKAGADVINVAGSTGGTGAAAVTSLKNTGRASELGIAEVHKALSLNGIRDKVVLRASNAHQTGADVLKSAILGADSFEFGTTALMMLKCVMAKNCNVKCPAGLTTNPEVFEGDARSLAQYFLNIAHDVREMLASLGFESLAEVRGRTHLLHLVDHAKVVGRLDFRDFLKEVEERVVDNPVYIEADFSIDDSMLQRVRDEVIFGSARQAVFDGHSYALENRNKSVGGQLAIDIERTLAYATSDQLAKLGPSVYVGKKGRRFLASESVVLRSTKSAGQSYACWMNDGMLLEHTGTCNDGVAKGACGGIAVIKSPGGGSLLAGQNVLIGNFALFGASGGRIYVNGEAGDRFAVRNSGAQAVVEGVGDFCCEYMTSGAVLNLGCFGKGFCNGMSGGNAYQYDPDDTLKHHLSADSVVVHALNDGSEVSAAHELIIRTLLKEHVNRTGSVLGEKLLGNWNYERQFFKFAISRALFKTQTIEGIQASMDSKSIIEELSSYIAQGELKMLKDGYATGNVLFEGFSPEHGEVDTLQAYKLLTSCSHLQKAVRLARAQLKQQGINEPTSAQVDMATRSLIVNEDFKLIELIAKDAKAPLADFSEHELAAKLAYKRVEDYKQSMIRRDIQDNHSLGSTAWILRQQRENKKVADYRAKFDEGFAAKSIASMQ